MYRGKRVSRAAALGGALLLLAGCASSGPTPYPRAHPSAAAAAPASLPRPDHVVVAIFENEGETEVDGAAGAPYLSSLAAAGASLSDSHGIAHPSQPNYVALFSGSPQGVADDSCPRDLGARPNLASQLTDAGFRFAGFAEGMPRDGFAGCSSADGAYRRKHNPLPDFSNVPPSANRTYRHFPADYSTLPTVSFVIPDMCHDMHDCPVSAGDGWAAGNLSGYARWAQAHNSLLIVTFDEDTGTPANRIPTILSGPMVRTTRSAQPIDHYSVLRTVEDMYGLAPLGEAASARPITGVWKR
ncbi:MULTISPECIES: alkaline phosphatase family protein [Amycolatopsis]|uniref:Acid phosphatase n=1 Tax=Amycolatopsis echigonensis TaxID=2576905 RepID=A0A2N3WL28_9PSEU|nr:MULTISPECIES: alkaline phosphatase family protein [Amycolatopsis]MBB2499960.1 acid phosphatase [Amycolatopsis echigonensis]MCG3751121.1 acid phosphatase [Amycolatopsis sp. Poz14]PKV94583.1 acid phosphatase [Amycolatopsis niigatensis]